MSNPEDAVFVGIDVSKDQLDIHVHPLGLAFREANTADGHAALAECLAGLTVVRIALEATGSYSRALVSELIGKGFAVAVVNPRQVRDFARASGQLAKTDAVDAAILARFAAYLCRQPKHRSAWSRRSWWPS